MARTKKKYANGQDRGNGTQPQCRSATPKDYYRQAVAYHGGEAKLEEFLQKLKE